MFSWRGWGIKEIFHKLFMGLDEGSSSMNMGTTAVTYIDTPESDTSLEQLCWIGRPGRGVLNRGRLLLGHVVVLVVALVFEGINLFCPRHRGVSTGLISRENSCHPPTLANLGALSFHTFAYNT